MDHIFADGNKRTALMLAQCLPSRYGFRLALDDSPNAEENEAYGWILAAVDHKKDMPELAEDLRARARKNGGAV